MVPLLEAHGRQVDMAMHRAVARVLDMSADVVVCAAGSAEYDVGKETSLVPLTIYPVTPLRNGGFISNPWSTQTFPLMPVQPQPGDISWHCSYGVYLPQFLMQTSRRFTARIPPHRSLSCGECWLKSLCALIGTLNRGREHRTRYGRYV